MKNRKRQTPPANDTVTYYERPRLVSSIVLLRIKPECYLRIKIFTNVVNNHNFHKRKHERMNLIFSCLILERSNYFYFHYEPRTLGENISQSLVGAHVYATATLCSSDIYFLRHPCLIDLLPTGCKACWLASARS